MVTSLRRRLPSQQQLFNVSPPLLRRLMVNAEAWRRDWFRRHGDYQAVLADQAAHWYNQPPEAQAAVQVERLNELLRQARLAPYYRRILPPDLEIRSLEDMRQVPILDKATARREGLNLVREGFPRKELWPHLTSGSTGTPLTFYHDRIATRAHQAAMDAMMAHYGCSFGDRRMRFSGAYVAPYEQRKPPFWIYIDRYRQLQCSAYHLGPDTYQHYLAAIRDARVTYGTGYATAWHLLATYLLESGTPPPKLKAIFTDSEGMTPEQQATTERAFGCPVYQTYGTGEIGQAAIHCPHKRYHVQTRAVYVEILDDNDQPVRPGETGQVIITDLFSHVVPYIRYRSGDLATLAEGPCECGWQSPSWTTVVGRVDDQIKTPEGRWIGRLSHVLKPGVGIRESQIVQKAIDRVVIRVVPDSNFEPASMEAVVAAAHRYLGESMQVSWELVDQLPRMKSGKLRHVVREI